MAWESVLDEQGRTYYFDSVTQESTWEKPAELLTDLERALLTLHWKLYTADGGQDYYYNEKTQESTWEIPADVQSYLNGKHLDRQSEVEPLKEKAVLEITEGTAEFKPIEVESIVEKEVKLEAPTVPVTLADDSALLNPPVYESLEAARAAFVNLLRANEVDATWSFSRVMKEFIQNPIYWALPDALVRKEIFESYLSTRTKDELLKENKSKEKFQEAFLAVLANYDEIKYYTRWPTAKRLISDEPIYLHSAISDKEKRGIFQGYVDGMRKAREERLAEVRKQATSELSEYFSSTLELDVNDSWPTTLSHILKDPRFRANKNFVVLHNMDILAMYEKSLDRIHENLYKQIKTLQERTYRQDRLARDAFKELLVELKAKGKINASTLFKDIFLVICDDDRFLDLVGRNGSTPLELFWDMVDEEDQVLRIKKDIINTILLEQKFNLAGATFEEFVAFLGTLNDVRVKEFTLDGGLELRIIRDKILQDLELQREQEILQKKRYLSGLAEDLVSYLLKHHQILNLSVDAKFEDESVQAKLKELEIYKIMLDVETSEPEGIDALFRGSFEKFTLYLKEEQKKIVSHSNPLDTDRLKRFESRKRGFSEVTAAPTKKEVELDY
ncbi:hypothetical protein BABINDRAFT_160755 [Babjeviella inositovora NRRL Y-12698]|uniref:Pre-mRNA-processing protein PRP40 n=1 Tax=Babjeviella inositovora NRRL Y-12698 TaxID=984486 RepID=A0A1E3QS06_9ASCO|nr:uncharacterized protein BABINDRAFT_160755 [Babjeviella inositovora NRRL Y-12698]ODQ80475.1 hypothetical protein BABINDRAFT_160755 [Babjeviella inositovora NRRL Y-12698]